MKGAVLELIHHVKTESRVLPWGVCAACVGSKIDLLLIQTGGQCRFCVGTGKWNKQALAAIDSIIGGRLKAYKSYYYY